MVATTKAPKCKSHTIAYAEVKYEGGWLVDTDTYEAHKWSIMDRFKYCPDCGRSLSRLWAKIDKKQKEALTNGRDS